MKCASSDANERGEFGIFNKSDGARPALLGGKKTWRAPSIRQPYDIAAGAGVAWLF
jgi:hypothetical protein